jgi:hypothetical protein
MIAYVAINLNINVKDIIIIITTIITLIIQLRSLLYSFTCLFNSSKANCTLSRGIKEKHNKDTETIKRQNKENCK